MRVDDGAPIVWVGHRGGDADCVAWTGRLAGIVCCDWSPELARLDIPVASLERRSLARRPYSSTDSDSLLPDLAHLLRRERAEPRRLSRAGVETLAIIAYHEPVSRAEIEAIRGVQISKGTLDVQMEAGWVRPAGRREGPGRPLTFATTSTFLAQFSLNSRKDLPGIDDLEAAGLLDPVDAAFDRLELESDVEDD